MRVASGLAIVVLVAGASWASPEAEWVCDRARNNAEHLQCADREFKKHDAELNQVFKELLKAAADQGDTAPGYGPPPLPALREAQRAWVTFRDANCHWKSTSFYGGSGQGVIFASCRALMTRDRVAELKAFQQN